MSINYTGNLGLPQITDRHDETESVAAMIACMAAIDAFPSQILVMDGEMLVYDDETLYFI
jgi:hypothetical protein